MHPLETATLGSGCFWCVEAILQRVEGVHSVISGYAGGHVKNPTYKQICVGDTGHAEVVQVTFDPQLVSYEEILEIFFKTHDPTTLNRQGADTGTQYRSVIFYHNDTQKQIAKQVKKRLDKSGAWKNPIVTEISPLPPFYKAEGYHQDYYNTNPSQPYCMFVVHPKVKKFTEQFADKLKS